MIASELISDSIPPLKTSDSADMALDWMREFGVHNLPVVDKGVFAGLVSENEILDTEDESLTVGQIMNPYHKPFITPVAHIYEVIKVMTENGLDILPVVDEKNQFTGTISAFSIMKFFASLNSLMVPGAILVVEIKSRDYSLAEIARICESNEIKILSCYVIQHIEQGLLEITLKLDKTELAELIASFERFNYTVKASYQETEYFEELKERYQSLMKYLNT